MRKRGQSGFALLLVFLMAAAIAITLYVQIPRVAFQAQRQKEQLLMERGEQYQRAIQLFVRANGRYPGEIKDLENFNNRRFLRHKFKDPITGKEEWRLIHVNAAGVFTDSLLNKAKPGDQKEAASTEGQYVGVQAGIGVTPLPGQQAATNPALRRRASEGGPPITGPDGQVTGIQGAGIAPMPGQPYPAGQNNPVAQAQPFPGAPQQQPQPVLGMPIPPNQPQYPGGQPVPPEVSNFPTTNVPGQPFQGRVPFPNQPQAGYQPGVPQQGVQQPGFQQPGQPGFQLPGQPGFQQPGATNQSSVGTSTYVGGNQPYVGGSQPYVGGGSSIGSQPTGPGTPGLIQGNPNPIPPPVQNFGQQGLPGGFPQPGLPQQNFPQQNFPQPQVNQGQINQPVPGGGFQPQAGGAPNAATQLIQNILTTPRQGGLPGAQPAGQQVGGGIAGVASTSENPSIMVYNDRTSYNEWEFIFDFSKQKAVVNPNVGGVIGTPASQIGTVAGPTPQPAVPGLGGGLSSLGQTAQPAIGTSPGAAPFGGANPAANPAAGQTPGGPSQGQAPNNIRMGRP
jgi:type II secretory pathway pseudopilin PulG